MQYGGHKANHVKSYKLTKQKVELTIKKVKSLSYEKSS